MLPHCCVSNMYYIEVFEGADKLLVTACIFILRSIDC